MSALTIAHRNLAFVLLLFISAATFAQQGVPRAAYVYPPGGKIGTNFEVTIGGQFLNGARDAVVSGKGVRAEVVAFEGPLPPQQMQAMRDELQKIVASHGGVPGRPNAQQNNANQQPAAGKNGKQRPRPEAPAQITPWNQADADRARELRSKIAESQRRQQLPALSNSVTLRVSIAPDAPAGDREIRIVGALGMSNPVVFCVDKLPEFSRPLQHVPAELARGGGLALGDQVRPAAAGAPTEITLPTFLNGQMMPGGVDSFKFHAAQGQHIVIAAKTRALIPYISDAVPGWFQATLSLSDAAGHELAASDHFRFSQDPVIEQDIPRDGDYVVSIHDSIFRGREDFVYRIAIGELPYVTGIFPLGAKQGAKTRVDLTGWNLPSARFAPPTRNPGVHLLSIDSQWQANPVSFAVDTMPEISQAQPTSIKNAKKVKLPVVVNGRIAKPGDVATFRIDAKSGDEIVADVYARRLGSPLDSALTLTDASGKQLAFNDDAEAPTRIGSVVDDNGSALLTHQADSRLSFRFATKGAYYLQIADAQRQGGAEYAYRLRISRPQPDFDLRVVPSSISVRPGMTVPAMVYVERRDGFTGDIALKINDAPAGLTLTGGIIPAGADTVRVTLTAPSQAAAAPRSLLLEGEAQIAGRTVKRVAVPADDMMQAFAWHHLVPAKEGLVLIFGGGRRNPVWKLSVARIKVPAGGTAQIRVGVPAAQFAQQVQLTLSDPPEGISVVDVAKVDGGLAVKLRADAKLKPGLKGNLIVEASMARPRNPANPNPGPNANRPIPIGTLPAIPFEIVP